MEPALPTDAAAVTELCVAHEVAMYGRTTFSQADLEEEWAELDLEHDVRVVRDGERIVGYSAMRERGEPWRVEGYVHPEAFGRGLGPGSRTSWRRTRPAPAAPAPEQRHRSRSAARTCSSRSATTPCACSARCASGSRRPRPFPSGRTACG